MKTFLVTVKLARNPAHDPHHKVTGPCPVNGAPCTDVTGEHHTAFVRATSADVAAAEFDNMHVTRIEELPPGSAMR